jgi:phosphomannomutase
MQIDPSIFKAYDIRGIFPEQITADTAYHIGAGLALYLQPQTIAVGRDMRLSSDELFEGFSRGLADQGVDVVDLGLVSTDALYFAVGKFGYDGGVQITASHNPKQYNGFKICRKHAEPLSGQEGLGQIRDLIADGSTTKAAPGKGVVIRRDIARDYADCCLSFIDRSKVKPFKVVIDAGNGMAGESLPPVLEKLPIEVTPLYFELDGTFPNHPASPIELENLKDLQKKIAEVEADFGVAFDGDADRMFLLDRNGRQLGGDVTTALVSKSLLAKQPGETVLYNLICSRCVPELIESLGGTAVRTRVGHALIKPLMKKHSGLIAFLVCLELISMEDRPLENMVAEIDPYVRSGEINSRVESAPAKLEELAVAFPDGEQDRLDGLTVQYDKWWFNVRPSNTEPLLRLNIEADNEDLLNEHKDRLLKIIRG